MSIDVANEGENTETFNVTAYANSSTIDTQQVNNLNATGQLTLTFTLNTTILAYGNYTISAKASLVPGETDVTDNTFIDGSVLITIPGDINCDFKVNPQDLAILAQAYGSKPDSANWNPNADINGNGKVDLPDLVLLALHYEQHYP